MDQQGKEEFVLANRPIADLHCDLLLYLEKDPQRSPYDKAVRCSLSQMRAGGVSTQVLPIFTETNDLSIYIGERQNSLFHALPHQFPDEFSLLGRQAELAPRGNKVAIIRAVENASSFCCEDEPLALGLARLSRWLSEGPIAYISLTWNSANRFGGGCHSPQGLGDDGKELLHFMHNKSVAIDLSHASDALAYDILDHIDKYNLALPLLASHSNSRTVHDAPRNLPDSLLKEVIARQGLVGLNLVKPFLGPHPRALVAHVKHMLALGGENSLALGADFFYEQDIPAASRRAPGEYFFEELAHSGAYSHLLDICQQQAALAPNQLSKLAYKNVMRFLSEHILQPHTP